MPIDRNIERKIFKSVRNIIFGMCSIWKILRRSLICLSTRKPHRQISYRAYNKKSRINFLIQQKISSTFLYNKKSHQQLSYTTTSTYKTRAHAQLSVTLLPQAVSQTIRHI